MCDFINRENKMTKRKVSRMEFVENQRSFCDKRDIPVFMPTRGYCYSCGRDIIDYYIKAGLKGDEEVVTGCPYCYYSFVG